MILFLQVCGPAPLAKSGKAFSDAQDSLAIWFERFKQEGDATGKGGLRCDCITDFGV